MVPAAGTRLGWVDLPADVREQLVIVDWPWGATAPVWFDRVLLALNITVHGGDPERVIAGPDRGLVTDVFAGFAGFFRDIARRPPPSSLPSVRAFQRWPADELMPWLRRELGP